ncbi:MAG: hypothetical protein CBC24_00550 [Candidatus Pelagibacter sp. TMED64]|nr:hypothetical protein [Candidatus Pelagibacter sp.]OUU67722.1 MAG: hypothetical protein CBC24_00550 [Candidatus Pelagibacter sp. TMED64]|tara:strand:- start:164 stop:610 length:447 start_codon:yes stop_codon:yes gene_type:complete
MVNEKLNLKLYGRNLDDLKVISAYLQDSIVSVRDIVFLKRNKTFLMMVNRFMWEDVEKGVFRKNKRIRSAITFNNVKKVISKNINQKNKERALELLTVKSFFPADNLYQIQLIFAGDNLITIFVEIIDVLLDDIGKPYFVKKTPKHTV